MEARKYLRSPKTVDEARFPQAPALQSRPLAATLAGKDPHRIEETR